MNWIWPKTRRRIYERDGYRCLWCLRRLAPKKGISLDHFLPRDAGGSNSPDNVFTCCLFHNGSRHKRPALTFAAETDNLEALDRIVEHLLKPLPQL